MNTNGKRRCGLLEVILCCAMVGMLAGCFTGCMAAAGGAGGAAAAPGVMSQVGTIGTATVKVVEAVAGTAPALIRDGENLVGAIQGSLNSAVPAAATATVMVPVPTTAAAPGTTAQLSTQVGTWSSPSLNAVPPPPKSGSN